MAKNIITIDVGNSNTGICVVDYQSKDIKYNLTIQTAGIKKATLCKDFLDLKDKYVPLAALISSVNPEATKKIKAALKEVDINTEIINPVDYSDILKLDVIGKYELGSDIFCGCVESARRFKSSITIDMGTAITFALVKDNAFIACAIYPGVRSAFNALFNDTALVNEVEIKEPSRMFGGNTVDAVRCGMLYGTLGVIKEIVARYKEVVKDAKIIFTGGASKSYIKYIDGCIYEKDLLHLGLAHIYLKRMDKRK